MLKIHTAWQASQNFISLRPDNLQPTGSPSARLAIKESPPIWQARLADHLPASLLKGSSVSKCFPWARYQMDATQTGNSGNVPSAVPGSFYYLFHNSGFAMMCILGNRLCRVFLWPQVGQDLMECGWRDEVKELVALISKPHFRVRRFHQIKFNHTFLKHITAIFIFRIQS